MKYSISNPPLVCMQTQSTCYKATRKMEVKGVLWHDTGANNPNLKRYVQPGDNDPRKDDMLSQLGKNRYGNDWNHISRRAGMNCWIGKLADGTVTAIQTMPWDFRPWGCGSGKRGSCNNGWIQFEICEDSKNNADYLEKAYQEACEITAYLCRLFHIDPMGTVECGGVLVPTILCHQDSSKQGLGSDHSDIYDWFPKFGKNMDTARKDVVKLLANDTADVNKEQDQHTLTESQVFEEEKNQKDQPQSILLKKNPPFLVRVGISNLQIYTGPGDQCLKGKKCTGKGTFTIVEVKAGNGSSNGWGLLKAYADKRNGWINLDHVTIR